MKKFLFFLFFLMYLNADAQKIDETVILADKMFEEGDCKQPLELYKRAIFFTNNKNKSALYIKYGDCFLKDKQYKNALNAYDSAIITETDQNILTDLNFRKTDCLIFLKQYSDAEQLILSINSFRDDDVKRKQNFYLGLVYFLEADFEKAEHFFLSSVPEVSDSLKQQIQEIFLHKKYFHKPNPKLAGVLSAVIPGSGQLYAGDYKNAINSFLLVAVFAVTGTDMYLRYAWYDSMISVFPWFFRYYNGGIKNAIHIAEQKRNEKRNKKLNELIHVIEN